MKVGEDWTKSVLGVVMHDVGDVLVVRARKVRTKLAAQIYLLLVAFPDCKLFFGDLKWMKRSGGGHWGVWLDCGCKTVFEAAEIAYST